MSAVWEVADWLGIVPSPPNMRLARSLSAWWERPRTFGCADVKTGAWFVCAPNPSIFCAEHAMDRLDHELRCMYCHGEVDPVVDNVLMYEMQHHVTVIGRAHTECEKEVG